MKSLLMVVITDGYKSLHGVYTYIKYIILILL